MTTKRPTPEWFSIKTVDAFFLIRGIEDWKFKNEKFSQFFNSADSIPDLEAHQIAGENCQLQNTCCFLHNLKILVKHC